MSTKYNVKRKGDTTGKVVSLDWQNASELVALGNFEWASGGSGSKEFVKAQKEARSGNTKPEGFDHLSAVKDDEDDDQDDDTRGSTPLAVAAVEPVSIATVASTKVEEKDPLAELTREELMVEAEKLVEAGKLDKAPDKRLGTKSLLTLVRENSK